MYKAVLFAVCAAALTYGQTPNISGVWKADLEKSKVQGPPVKSYLALIEQREGVFNRRTGEKAPQVTETSQVVGEHGEHRSDLTFFEYSKPAVRPYEGVPAQLIGTAEGNTITLRGKIAGKPVSFTRTYELSSDAQTLTISMTNSNNGKEQQSTWVLTKQPDSAAQALREPEKTAEAEFKNVKTSFKTLPASQFIDQMRYISWALDKDCEFCHVRGKFDSDDKKEKRTARKMIDMTSSIDEKNFEGHPEVRCFTCHEQHAHPLSYPLFPEQIAEQKAASEPHPE